MDITVDDLGKEGSGGALSSSKQIEIEVTAANSAPVITVPGLQSIAQGILSLFLLCQHTDFYR